MMLIYRENDKIDDTLIEKVRKVLASLSLIFLSRLMEIDKERMQFSGFTISIKIIQS